MANNYFTINGLIDTNNNVLDNINALANASGCFLTWDPALGKWSVIINTTGTSVKSFNDSNIIGEINVSGTGINELYNSVSVSFPNKDTRDTVDVIELEVASADRFPQELDNQLALTLVGVNDPVQAQYIGSRELKQSRLDKIIEFRTNYEANDVRAGDLIDVTNAPLDFTSKLFRVVQIDEEDDEDGNLIFSVTAQEYDADVYSTSGLSYDYRSNFTGIKSQVFNAEIDAKNDYAASVDIGRLLAANLGLGLLNSFFTSDDATETVEQGFEFKDPDINSAVSSLAKPTGTVSVSSDKVCSGSSVTFSVAHSCSSCFFDNPEFDYAYEITGVVSGECSVPLTGTLTTVGTSAATLTPTFTLPGATQKTATFTVGGSSTTVTIYPPETSYVIDVTASAGTITEGDSVNVTVTTSGYSDGSTLPYTISGTASSKVSSPSLTGNVTLNSNTATLNISTTDDSAYNTAQYLTVTIGTASTNPCVISSNDNVTITVNNNATTGPIPPSESKPGDFSCTYVQVPVIWCGTFDADTQYIKSVSVKKYAYLPQAPVGGTAVPTSLTITDPGTSSAAISIGSTVNIDPASLGMGGAAIEVITSGFTALGGGDTLITGTLTTFHGYWD